MLNIEVLGSKAYAARNPKWTRLGKSGKDMIGLRANGQKPGPVGVGGQSVIRKAFAETAMNSLYGQYGKDERGMPIVADLMQANFPSQYRKTEESKIQARREKAAASHNATLGRWRGGGYVPASPYPAYGGRPAPMFG